MYAAASEYTRELGLVIGVLMHIGFVRFLTKDDYIN
jgi:hypothetical protein